MGKNIKRILKEEVENYMFFQNLKTIKTHVDMLLAKSPKEMDKILKKHDWASDHMSTAKDDIEEICNFFTNGYASETEKEDKTIECSGCDWSWKESESDPEDLYVCHECGTDNTPKVDEAKGPCWKGYEQIGMKKKNGKEVPNCVPIKENTLTEDVPERYKKKGFKKVGVKKQAPDGDSHKWEVLAKKGDKYKIVKGGYRGMKDYSQHKDKDRKTNFWDRVGGKDSAKAKDPFSALYWHKRFGTW